MAQVDYIESITLYLNCKECGYEMSLNPGKYKGHNRTTGCCGATSEANLVQGHYVVTSTKGEEVQDVDFIQVRTIKFVDDSGNLQTTTAPKLGHTKKFTYQSYGPLLNHTCTITTKQDGTIEFGDWKTTIPKEDSEEEEE